MKITDTFMAEVGVLKNEKGLYCYNGVPINYCECNSGEELKKEFITLEGMYDALWEDHERLKKQVSEKDDTTIYFTEKINYNTNYKIYYKNPRVTYEDKKFKGFIGKVENFVPSGLCAFMNSEGEMLHVHYRDIIQMHVTKENK